MEYEITFSTQAMKKSGMPSKILHEISVDWIHYVMNKRYYWL
jgi:hypothetical protein